MRQRIPLNNALIRQARLLFVIQEMKTLKTAIQKLAATMIYK